MRKEKAEKHEFRVLDPSITEAWSSASLGALKAADTRLSRGHVGDQEFVLERVVYGSRIGHSYGDYIPLVCFFAAALRRGPVAPTLKSKREHSLLPDCRDPSSRQFRVVAPFPFHLPLRQPASTSFIVSLPLPGRLAAAPRTHRDKDLLSIWFRFPRRSPLNPQSLAVYP